MNTRLLLLFFIAAIVGLSACKKNNDTPTVTSTAFLNIVNASTDTVNFYLNGTRLNNNSNLYPAGSSGYFSVTDGQQNYQVKKLFNPVTNTVQTLFSIPLKLDSAGDYSLFITDGTLVNSFSTKDVLLAVPDTLATTNCYVRFVNASPGTTNFDLAVGDTVKFTNVPFKSVSGFQLVGVSGLKPISIYQTGSATPIISGHIALTPGYSYTFYSYGKLNGTGNSALGIGFNVYN